MIRMRTGVVKAITGNYNGVTEAVVEVEGLQEPAVNYDFLTGPIKPGNCVILNTTATRLALGSGGYHFVMYVLGNESLDPPPPGHIIKLRYTPWQVKCLSAEEETSPIRRRLEEFEGLDAMPVVVAELHSMLPAACAGVRAASARELKIAYLMTDGGALPIAYSKLVKVLKDSGFLWVTITVGNAFGGDYEAINIYSGLAIAKTVGADVAIVAMGPGIAGTGTKYGFSGIEQGQAVNAVNSLGGTPVFIPRISFADPRPRHRGLSHHSLTNLREVAVTPAIVCLPDLPRERWLVLRSQLDDEVIKKRHVIVTEDGVPGVNLLKEEGVPATTMGRGLDDDPEFFLAAAAAGSFAARVVTGCRFRLLGGERP
ncbi:MAG TPA: DUF3866 family protein [Firmicutes bacterium]|nr:DUF3866 family protein [Bacillota bacterium]